MKQSKFLENASYRLKNKKWLRYSSNISRRILASLEEQNIDRSDLADKLGGVTRQYVSRLLQGKENLSLQSIANLSDALGVELITFPPYRDSIIEIPNSDSLNDILANEYLKKEQLASHFDSKEINKDKKSESETKQTVPSKEGIVVNMSTFKRIA